MRPIYQENSPEYLSRWGSGSPCWFWALVQGRLQVSSGGKICMSMKRWASLSKKEMENVIWANLEFVPRDILSERFEDCSTYWRLEHDHVFETKGYTLSDVLLTVDIQSKEKVVAPHSSTLAWKIPWTEEPGGLQPMESHRIRHDWATSLSLFHFHALEKETATHSSVLAWRIPGMGEPGGLLSLGSHRVGHDWSNLAAAAAYIKK